MEALSTLPMLNMDSNYGVDKLTYEIFSILENKFLFGYGEPNSKISNPEKSHNNLISSTNGGGRGSNGKVRILSIDGGGATGGILAADSLFRLEASLRRKSGNPNGAIADYFDVVAGSGAGGVLAAMLFTRGRDGGPLFTAEEALKFLVKNRRKIFPSSPAGFFRRVLRSPPAKAEKIFSKVFGEFTLRDTLKSVLIPCYDLSSGAPFLFSRADAFEMDGYDFKMKDVCAATSADPTISGAFEMKSVDQRTKILAVDGGIAMNNPTAAAITHVLNNKQEFPLCNGVEDLLVVSLGNGESEFGAGDVTSTPATARLLRIAGEGASDLVRKKYIYYSYFGTFLILF